MAERFFARRPILAPATAPVEAQIERWITWGEDRRCLVPCVWPAGAARGIGVGAIAVNYLIIALRDRTR